MTTCLHTPACRFAADSRGQKSLCTVDGCVCLAWKTVNEYSLTAEIDGIVYNLDALHADRCEALSDSARWGAVYAHAPLSVEVVYTLTDTVLEKTLTVTATQPATLQYAVLETARVGRPLTRGGEGQPLFVGEDGFVAGTLPVNENRADGDVLSVHSAPFAVLKAGESFTLPTVIFGLNCAGDMKESFLRYLRPRRPHPNDSLRVYCDWGAHDELSDDDPPLLDEAMACRLLNDLQTAKGKIGLTFDYYLMDAHWFAPDAPYTSFDPVYWPNGPQKFLRAVEDAGLVFGLWFDVNLQKVVCEKRCLRSGTTDMLCMADADNMARLFSAIDKQIEECGIRMIKFDFAYFACDDASHTHHSRRHIASEEPAVRGFIEQVDRLYRKYPDFQILAYNGFTTDLEYIGSVNPHRQGYAISPFWALAVDYVYCGDPRPADRPAPLEKSLVFYTDCMIEQFRDSLFPVEAIDDHGTMVGETGTIYYLDRRTLRDSYLMNIVRGTRKCHLYGETSLLTEADWRFLADAGELFDFVCDESCHTAPVLEVPSKGGLYGYSTTDGNRGVVTVVNSSAKTGYGLVTLPCWQTGEPLLLKRVYHAGEWDDLLLPTASGLSVSVEPFGVDMYYWERQTTDTPCGYLSVDSETTVTLPLSPDCRCISLRFTDEAQAPVRSAGLDGNGVTVTAVGGTAVKRDNVPIWSGVSYSVWDITADSAAVSLQITNSSDKAYTVFWQDMTGEG